MCKYFRDGPYLKQGRQLVGRLELNDILQRTGTASFSAARRNLVEGLSDSLSHRFEMENIVQAMVIANFNIWPLPIPENEKEIQGQSQNKMLLVSVDSCSSALFTIVFFVCFSSVTVQFVNIVY